MSSRTKAGAFGVGQNPYFRSTHPKNSNVEAVTLHADRTRTPDLQAQQFFLGSDTASQDLLSFGGQTTASLIESTSLVDASGGSFTITLPSLDTDPNALLESNVTGVGFLKTFIMTTDPGFFSAAIVPANTSGRQQSQIVTLSAQWQSATFLWMNTGWALQSNVTATTGGSDLFLKVHPSSAPVTPSTSPINTQALVVMTSPFDPQPDLVPAQVFNIFAQSVQNGELQSDIVPAPFIVNTSFFPWYGQIDGQYVSNDNRYCVFYGSYQYAQPQSPTYQIKVGLGASVSDVITNGFTLPQVLAADGVGSFVLVCDPRNGHVAANILLFLPQPGSNNYVKCIGASIDETGLLTNATSEMLYFAVTNTNISGTPNIITTPDTVAVFSCPIIPGQPLVPSFLGSIMASQDTGGFGGRLEGVSFERIQDNDPGSSDVLPLFCLLANFTGQAQAQFLTSSLVIAGPPYTGTNRGKPGALVAIISHFGNLNSFTQICTDDSGSDTAVQYSALANRPLAQPPGVTVAPFSNLPFARAGGLTVQNCASQGRLEIQGKIFVAGTGSGNILVKQRTVETAAFSTTQTSSSTAFMAVLEKQNQIPLYVTGSTTAQSTYTGAGGLHPRNLFSQVQFDGHTGNAVMAIQIMHDPTPSVSPTFDFAGLTLTYPVTNSVVGNVMYFRIDAGGGVANKAELSTILRTYVPATPLVLFPPSPIPLDPITSFRVDPLGGQFVVAGWGDNGVNPVSAYPDFGWHRADVNAGVFPAPPSPTNFPVGFAAGGIFYGDTIGNAKQAIPFAPNLTNSSGVGGGRGFFNQGVWTNANVTWYDLWRICNGSAGPPSVLPTPSVRPDLLVMCNCAFWCIPCQEEATAYGGLTGFCNQFPNILYACCSFENQSHSTMVGASGGVDGPTPGAGTIGDACRIMSVTTGSFGPGVGPGFDNVFIISDLGGNPTLGPYGSDQTGSLPTCLCIDPATMQIIWEFAGFGVQETHQALTSMMINNISPAVALSQTSAFGTIGIADRNLKDQLINGPTSPFATFPPPYAISINSQSITYFDTPLSQGLNFALTSSLAINLLGRNRKPVGVVVDSTPDSQGHVRVRFPGSVILSFAGPSPHPVYNLSPGCLYSIDSNGIFQLVNEDGEYLTKQLFVAIDKQRILLLQ